MTSTEKINLSHKTSFRRFAETYPPDISEHTFTNLFAWRGFRPVFVAELNNAFIAAIDRGNCMTFLGPPLGPISLRQAVQSLAEIAGKPVAALERIPEQYLASAGEFGWRVVEDRDNFDYIYRRSDLAKLNGRRFHAKRNLIAQFLANHNCKYEEIDKRNLSEVVVMMDRWCMGHECGKDTGLCSENIAIGELLNNYFDLGVIGAAIRIDDKIEAFTIGEKLNKNTAVVHFEKAIGEFKGLYQFINQSFCKNHLSEFEFINREQDLGLEGLRKAKTSYFPDHFTKKYTIYPDPKMEGSLPHGLQRIFTD